MTNASAPVSRRCVRRAAALLIGSELLTGKVRDENLQILAKTLRSLGVELARVVFCPDDRSVIQRDIKELSQQFDLVGTSGGVGPTHDDITMEAVAAGLEKQVALSQKMRSFLEARYGDLTETHLSMAMLPQEAQLVEGGDRGDWPIVVVDNVWIFPGVPQLFRAKLATLRKHLKGPGEFYSQELYLKADEIELKQRLDELVSDHPEVEVGSYPKWLDARYKTKVTFDSRSKDAVQLAFDDAQRRFAESVVSVS
jgi:molybdenum cofactor synthesis domain-containing protein